MLHVVAHVLAGSYSQTGMQTPIESGCKIPIIESVDSISRDGSDMPYI